MSCSDLRKVQLIEVEILDEVVRICDKHNIEYFLDSGTALGAVRHCGVIPWDDDIDIGMTRKNYEKFMEIAVGELSSAFFLQNRDTDRNAPYIYGKVRKNDTIFVEWNNRNISMHRGIYIDIFPYDNLPDNPLKRKIYQRFCNIAYKFYSVRSNPIKNVKPQNTTKYKSMSFLRKVLHLITKLIPYRIVERITLWLFQFYNKKETKYITCHSFSRLFTFKRRDILPSKLTKFEKSEYLIANNVEQYLSNIYGDYMKLPPVEKRVGHRPYRVEC